MIGYCPVRVLERTITATHAMPPDEPEKSNVDLEALIVEQEHRPFHLLRNFLFRNRRFPEGDPRRDAARHAVLWAVVRQFSPASPMAAAAISTLALILSILLLYKQNQIVDQQKRIEAHDLLFQSNTELLKILFEHPSLRLYFDDDSDGWHWDSLPEDSDERARVLTYCELLADLFGQVVVQLNHLEPEASPSWEAYIRHMYRNSKAFREYFNDNKQFYNPRLADVLEVDEAPSES